MILLNSTASLEVLLAGAITTSQGVIYCAYSDMADDGSTFAPGLTTIATNSTTAVTAAAAPASGDVRQVKFLSLYNADTAAMTATVRVVDNATNRILVKVALAIGERLEYTDGKGFRVLSATGAEKGASSGGGSSVSYGVACSDMTTDLTTGTGKGYFRAPHAMTGLTFRASLFDASSSGAVTVDVNKNGSTILSTKLTIDATEKTSVTAATPYVATSVVCSDDDEFTFDIDGAGTDAKGLIVWVDGTRT